MGATTFMIKGHGTTAQHAFAQARQKAKYDHGHAGYTGTIAEKRSVIEIPVPEGREPVEYAHDLLNTGDARVDDKWGPAGAIRLGETTWILFGWASE